MKTLWPMVDKNTFIFASLFFFLAAFSMTGLDRHYAGFSPTCPICKVKSSLNGGGESFAIIVHPVIVFYPETEYPSGIAIPFLSSIQNKSPPSQLGIKHIGMF
jgi:hypothetical protein